MQIGCIHNILTWGTALIGTYYDLDSRLAEGHPLIGRIMQQMLNRVEYANAASYLVWVGGATFDMVPLYAIEWWVALLLVPSQFELESRLLVQYNSKGYTQNNQLEWGAHTKCKCHEYLGARFCIAAYYLSVWTQSIVWDKWGVAENEMMSLIWKWVSDNYTITTWNNEIVYPKIPFVILKGAFDSPV